MKKWLVLILEGSPSLYGPYPDESSRDDVALALITHSPGLLNSSFSLIRLDNAGDAPSVAPLVCDKFVKVCEEHGARLMELANVAHWD